VREQFGSALIVGALVVAVAVAGILFFQRGAHMELTGPMSVRILSTDPHTSLAVFDLQIANPSDYDFEVINITATLITAAGEFPTTTIGRVDAESFFKAMPENGPFHPTLYTKAIIPGHSNSKYTLLAQYSAPEKLLNDRKNFVVRIQEINGKFAEFREKPEK
jgi:hypothetical protein